MSLHSKPSTRPAKIQLAVKKVSFIYGMLRALTRQKGVTGGNPYVAKRCSMHMTKLVAALGLALGVSAGAHAGVGFDPDGAGPAPAIDLGGMGWSTTSAVAVGGVTAIAAGPGATFTVLTHARLVDTTSQAGGFN